MSRVFLSATLAFLVWLGISAWSLEGSLSLEEAMVRARDQSPELAAERATLEAMREREKGAGAYPNPTLHLSGVSGQQTESDQFVNVPLDILGTRHARQEVARAERIVAEARLRVRLTQLERDVAFLYSDALTAELRLQTMQGELEVARRIAQVARRRYEQGVATLLPALRAEQEVAEQSQAALASQEERDRWRAALRIALGLNVLPALQAEPVANLDEATLDHWGKQALQDHPTVVLAQRGVAVPEAQIGAAESERLPVFDLQAYRQTPYSGPGGVRLVMEVPLFDLGAIGARVAEAGQRKKAAEFTVETARREVATRVETAHIALTSASTRLGAWKDSLKRAEHLLELAQRGFQAGVTAYPEVLEAQRTELRVRLQGLDLERALQRAQADFQFAVGRERGQP